MKRKKSVCFFILNFYFFILQDCATSQSCTCIETAEGGLPPIFQDHEVQERILAEHQAIVTSYQFQCYGDITEWGVDVYSDNISEQSENSLTNRITVQFQVWRPSPMVDSDGCYSLVGENRASSVILQGVIRKTPSVGERIAVQPGDVVGFRLEGEFPSASPGVVLDPMHSRETVWYGNTGMGPLTQCPFPVGTSGNLTSFTSLGPLITASLVTTGCPMPKTTTSVIRQSTPLPSVTIIPITTATFVQETVLVTQSPPNSDQSADLLFSTTHIIVIIVCGMTSFILLASIVTMISVFVCWRVNKKVKGQQDIVNPDQNRISMNENSAYQMTSNTFSFRSGRELIQHLNKPVETFTSLETSEPTYEDILDMRPQGL